MTIFHRSRSKQTGVPISARGPRNPGVETAAASLLAVLSVMGTSGAAQAGGNSTDTAMYFHSQVKDAADCAMAATSDGNITFADGIPAPAASCPDAEGWRQLLTAIQAQFWVN